MSTEARSESSIDELKKKYEFLPNGALAPMKIVATEERPPNPDAPPAKKKRRKGSANRWALLNDFIDGLPDSNLSPLEVGCWMILFRHANAKNLAVVSQSIFIKSFRRDERTIQRTLGKLIREGWLKCFRQRGIVNRYTLKIKHQEEAE